MTKKLFDNRRKRLSRRRVLFEKVQGFVEGTSDVKKAKGYLAELNFISWLVQYINHALQEQVCHLANLPLTVQLRAVEKSLIMRSNQMGMMKIPFENKNVSNSGYNGTADADTESVCSTAITNRNKIPF